MKTRFLIAAPLMMIALAGQSQQITPSVITPNGGTGQAAGIQLEWTLGEPAVSGTTGQALSGTEGFHQPLLTVQRVETSDTDIEGPGTEASTSSITIAPNPVTSELTIRFSRVTSEQITCTLLGADGSAVLRQEIDPQLGDAQLDLSGIASGYYILQLHAADGTVYPVFRISKIQ
jgi:hypothetical protein